MLNTVIQNTISYFKSIFLFIKGDILRIRQNPEDALHCLNQAISIRPKASYYKAKGIIHYNLEEYEEAIDTFNCIVKDNTQDIDVYIYRMKSFYKLGQYEDAFLDYCTVIEISPLFGRIEVYRIKRLILEKIKIKRRTKLKNIALTEDDEIDYYTFPELLSTVIGSLALSRWAFYVGSVYFIFWLLDLIKLTVSGILVICLGILGYKL